MKKLLQLLNEYEESRWSIVAEDSEEYQAAPTRLENDGHVRHINANKVAYEKDTFDAYILSNKYGFIKRLSDNHKLHTTDVMRKAILEQVKEWHEWEAYTQWLALSDKPISDLITYLS